MALPTDANATGSWLRAGCQRLVGSKLFERTVLLLILANCVTLTLYSPMDQRCETTQCQRLRVCEITFSSLAILECMIRIIAEGGIPGYWRDPWNRLDLAIVTCGIIDFIPGVTGGGSIKAFRTTRVLRPLRVVNRFPSLRILVRLLLDIIPMLGNVMVLCIFLFVTFGIMSVQLWKGVLRNGCYNEKNELYRPTLGGFYVCSGTGDAGMNSCPATGNFGEPLGGDNYTECHQRTPNFQAGAVSFDNIWMAFLAIFQVVTLEDWTGLMYTLQDAYSFWVWPFFIALIFFGSWFAINLALVVIATQFKVTKKRETMLIRAHEAETGYTTSTSQKNLWGEFLLWACSVLSCGRFSASNLRSDDAGGLCIEEATDEEIEDLQMIREVFDLLDKDRDGTISLGELRVALHTLDNHLAKTEVKELVQSIDENGDGYIDFDEFRALMGCTIGSEHAAHEQPLEAPYDNSSAGKDRSGDMRPTVRSRIHKLVNAPWFTRAVVLCITANTLSMASEHHGQPAELEATVEITNAVFAFIFFIEVILRVASVGPLQYFLDGFNVCDGIIVVMGVIEVFVPSGAGFNVLRSFRLMRLFKLARYLPTMQKQLLVMLRTLDSVLNFLLLLGLFIFMFAVMGMHLFGGSWESYSSTQMDRPRQNFDTFLYSVLTVFQVLTTEEWNLLLYHAMHATSKYAAIYFVVLIMIGTFILVNLFVAIMVEGFATDPEAIARFRAALARARTMFRTMHADASNSTISADQQAGRSDPANGNQKGASVQRAGSELSSQSRHTYVSSPSDSAIATHSAQRSDAVRRWACCTSKVGPATNDGSSVNANPSSTTQLMDDEAVVSVEPGDIRQAKAVSGAPRSYSQSLKKRSETIAESNAFHLVMMIVLCIDTIVMCVERPSVKEGSAEKLVLNGIDIGCETVFTIEAVVKICATGLWRSSDAYFRDRWNTYDFTLLVCSWSLVAIRHSGSQSEAALIMMWIFQLYRTFRPFRLVQRIPSLKETLRMLLMSVKPIGNLLLMGSVFYIIFAIWGVQMFKGHFFFCSVDTVDTTQPVVCDAAKLSTYGGPAFGSSVPITRDEALLVPGNLSLLGFSASGRNSSRCSIAVYPVEDARDCNVAGGKWSRRRYNFDNVLEALVTLFVVSSRDGWTEIMRNGLDSTGDERHPKEDANLMAVLYFVTFLLIVGYFVISMFVGVIVENFQLSMPAIPNVDDGQNDAEESDADAGSAAILLPARKGAVRQRCFDIMHHPCFEIVLAILISINVLIMALEHYDQPSDLGVAIEISNVVFTAIYCTEVVVKVLGVGAGEFIRQPWNRFDTFVAVSSFIGCFFDLLGDDTVVDASILQAVRVMRVARVIKLLKMTKGLASLLTTVWSSMPQVLNLMILLSILFVAASSLGMKLFGEVKCLPDEPCYGFSKHANFQNAGMAALTLFRVATGDDWVGIMRDGTRGQHGVVTTVVYFISFVVVAQFILLNVVVAVLMKNLTAALQWVDTETGETQLADTVGHSMPEPYELDQGECSSVQQSGAIPPVDTSRRAQTEVGLLEHTSETTTEHGPVAIPENEVGGELECNVNETDASARRNSKAQNVLKGLQARAKRLSDSQVSEPAETGPDGVPISPQAARAARNKRALKGALHLVMALVKMMDKSERETADNIPLTSRKVFEPRVSVAAGHRQSVAAPYARTSISVAARQSQSGGHPRDSVVRTSVMRTSVAGRRSVRLSIRAPFSNRCSVGSARSSVNGRLSQTSARSSIRGRVVPFQPESHA